MPSLFHAAATAFSHPVEAFIGSHSTIGGDSVPSQLHSNAPLT